MKLLFIFYGGNEKQDKDGRRYFIGNIRMVKMTLRWCEFNKITAIYTMVSLVSILGSGIWGLPHRFQKFPTIYSLMGAKVRLKCEALLAGHFQISPSKFTSTVAKVYMKYEKSYLIPQKLPFHGVNTFF